MGQALGKTSTAKCLFKMLNNSAHLDGDWLWNVNPFSLDDPRLRDGDESMSFALGRYLKSKFDYVIFSSCIAVDKEIRENILADIDYRNFDILGFTLTCSKEVLKERHYGQGATYEVAYSWLEMETYPNDFLIDTDNKSIEDVSEEIYSHIIKMKEEIVQLKN